MAPARQFHAAPGLAAVRSPKLKRRWLQVPAPPASLEATLANVAHLETDMMLPTAGLADAEKLLPRPYTSGAVSAVSADAMFSTDNSTFSTRPSTSGCSLGAQTRASSRIFRPRPWCRTSPKGKSARSNLGESSGSLDGCGSQTHQSRDRRGYETFEQLLQPGWRSPAELRTLLAPKPQDEADTGADEDASPARRNLPYGRKVSFVHDKRNAVVLGVGKTIWGAKRQSELDAADKPLYQQKRNALQQTNNSLFALRGQLEPPPDESSSATSSDDATESSSSDSVDPMLATDIGDLLPQKSAVWASTLTTATQESHLSRRGGLDMEMMRMAEFAVAAQQAAMREAEEASLPPEALPGVYAGHLESPRSILLPRTPKVGRLRKLEHQRLEQDNVHQRKLLCLPQQDRDFEYLRMAFGTKLEDAKLATGGMSKRKMASTWESGSKEQNSKVLSPEEEERIKEEKAQYDDWRRQVLLCARHLNTHINRFETDPIVGQGIML